ncbi:hypothetical protein AHAS_Ahas19G0129100 [Arachis hypogaea]
MVAKMRSKKILKELSKLDLKTIEAMVPNPFHLTKIDIVVSLQNLKYGKVNRATIKANKRLYCKKDRAILQRIHIGIYINNKDYILELPEIFKAIIASLKEFDVTFVMERKLTKTDLEPNNSWLAMSEKQINEECKFLEHKDVAIMRILEVRDGKGRLIGMKVGLIEPSDEVFHDQVLKKWNMTSASTYNLASSSWCDLARRNHLKTNHLLNIWCFNDATNKFYFLLHHVRSEPFEPCNEINT